jgi:hypothetical protein
MKMLVCALCLTAAFCVGCAKRPLTESEFRGFCYTVAESRNASCDTIVMCDDFDSSVVGMPHKSRAECEAACQAVYNRLYDANLFISCAPTLLNATNWCVKYCNTNFPQ